MILLVSFHFKAVSILNMRLNENLAVSKIFSGFKQCLKEFFDALMRFFDVKQCFNEIFGVKEYLNEIFLPKQYTLKDEVIKGLFAAIHLC